MTILSNGLDSRYVTSADLNPYLVDKSTGTALAGGQVFFYEDDSRTTPKVVYQLSYDLSTGLYSYVALPNPIHLSGVGTIDDGNGNNIALYYFPYDEFGNLQLYYITAYDSNNLFQFSRDAWPYNAGAGGGGGGGGDVTIDNAIGLQNMITNPQFARVSFIEGSTLTVSYTGNSTTVVGIAPGWDLNIVHTNSGSLTVVQNPIIGSSALPFNPPFTLGITPGINLTKLSLTQSFNNNPDWAAPQLANVNGYVSTSILLGPATNVTINYLQSNDLSDPQLLLTQNNATGAYEQFNATVELDMASNTDNGITGYDLIEIILSTTLPSVISNVQIVPLIDTAEISVFGQTTVNRQVDQMFNYYKPQLDFKPIPSYLVGWDFVVAPFQTLGTSGGPYATGANSAVYINETTIVFQSVSNSFTFGKSDAGALFLTATTPTQLAIVQYVQAPMASAVLIERLCSMVSSVTNSADGYPVTVSIWQTDNVSLPSTVVSNDCFINTLDANGHPNSVVAGWVEVPRGNLGNAKFTTAPTPTDPYDSHFNYHGFAGWNETQAKAIDATYLAIVVGTGTMSTSTNFGIQSVSLQAGDIPTIPAPQSFGQTLSDCQQFYEKSFNIATVPATAVGAGTGEFVASQVWPASSGSQLVGTILYKVTKFKIPNLITTYNPINNNAQVYNLSASKDCANVLANSNAQNGFYITCSTASATQAGDNLAIHWTSDARLGY